jgi:hypothetical protein
MTEQASAHAAIGRAICASQVFEFTLTISFEAFRMITEPEYRDLTEGRIDAARFKTPVKNLLKALSARNDISETLEAEITDLIERRHTMVHRWSYENGVAEPSDDQHWRKYEALARSVESDSNRIAHLLLSYMLKWGDPEWAGANKPEYLGRMKQLFRHSA